MVWIAVENAVPKDEGQYLCHFADGSIEVFPYKPEWDRDFWGLRSFNRVDMSIGNKESAVTHWMPLPAAPQ